MTIKVYTDARDALFEELFEFACQDRSVMLLSGDQGAFSFQKFQDQIPDQFINVGIAEQNMISVAAGLAMTGHKVVVYGSIPFATIRCLEQIKVDLCTQNLPVAIVGVGAGVAVGVGIGVGVVTCVGIGVGTAVGLGVGDGESVAVGLAFSVPELPLFEPGTNT